MPILPLLLLVSSIAVFALSLLLLLQAPRPQPEPAHKEDIASILGRIEAVWERSGTGGGDNGVQGYGSRATTNQKSDEANRWADKIRNFRGLLDQWCDLMRDHLGTSELRRRLGELSKVEEQVRLMQRPLMDARNDFMRLSVALVRDVVPMTDRSEINSAADCKELDQLVTSIVESAGLVLIAPKEGAAFNPRKHRMSSTTPGSTQGSLKKIRHVHARGLQQNSDGPVILLAEVEVG